jgi:hypothetical protein
MITLDTNNFGGGSVTLKDYQSDSLCVLNGKITVDPTHSAYLTAPRLELDLPADFAMVRSALSTAILVSNASVYRYGTVLKCWIENNKLCIEKLTAWDTFGNYDIHIQSAFVTRGHRGGFSETATKSLTILNDPAVFRFNEYKYVETLHYVFFVSTFIVFPSFNTNGQGPFTLQLSGFATDVLVEIPVIVQGQVTNSGQKGSMLTTGTFENGNLTFSFPAGANDMGGEYSFFNFFAVRG